jgi:hypothetical protein
VNPPPSTRSFRLVLVILVAAAALLAGVAASGASRGAPRDPGAKPATAGSVRVAALQKRRRHRHRHGCHKYCRQAGGFGAIECRRHSRCIRTFRRYERKNRHCDAHCWPVLIRHQQLRAHRHGIVGIRVSCRWKHRCFGAILLPSSGEYGRADLRVRAHTTRTQYVRLTKRARRQLRRRGPDRAARAYVYLRGRAAVGLPYPANESRRLVLRAR